MKTVLFVILPYKSHYYPAFALAEKYRLEGYKVLFTGTPHFQQVILNQSHGFVSLFYLSEYIFSSSKQLLGIFIKNLLDKSYLKERCKEYYKVQMTLRKIIEILHPDKIILETNISEYYLFFEHVGIETELISIFLSTEKKKNIPPLNSNFIPRNSIVSILTVEFLWYKLFLTRWFKDILIKIAFLGKDDYFFQKRICKKKEINWNQFISKNHFHANVCKNLRNNILVSPSLEFKTYKANQYESFSDLRRKRSEDQLFSEKYLTTKNNLISLKKEGKKIIYMAFGTLISINDKRLTHFIRNIVEIVEKGDDLRLILSFPFNLDFSKELRNTNIFEFLPQLDILQFSDLMITHGGLSSVKECMDAKVKMLVVPINTKIDQPGNAARVEANGLGKRVFLDTKSSKIEDKIKLLLK